MKAGSLGSAARIFLDNERKQSKLIVLIEELRRDLPAVNNRQDRQAEALGKTVHPEKVFNAIDQNLEGKN